MLGCCAWVFAAFLACVGLVFRLAAANGPEDDIDKASETASAYWLLGVSGVLIVLGIVLYRAGSRRRRAADLLAGTDR
jgi:hypothetical protein